MNQCPICKSYEIQCIVKTVHVLGGSPPKTYTCQKCGYVVEVPAQASPEPLSTGGTVKTCGNCKYRGEEITRWDYDIFEDISTGFFQCQRIHHDPAYNFPKGEGAVVHDGSGYVGKLCVEAEFGCIKHEPIG